MAIRALTSGLPRDLEREADQLKTRKLALWRKDDVIVRVPTDKKLVRMTSTMHEATVVNAGRNDKRTSWKLKKKP